MRRSAAQPVRICRRRFIGSLTGGLLASPLAARAQHTGTVHRIGVLENLEAGSNVANLNAFRQRLRELGYVEGQNLVIEYRSADGRAERFPDLAIELVQLKPEVIVTNGDSAASAARRATQTTPIVMASSLDPVGAGVVANLARPAGNGTGFHFLAPPKLGGQRLQIL